MGSAKQDRSLGGGISLPQWMKGKMDRFDFEQNAFSPPSHDDSFFYIRYPKPQDPPTAAEGYKTIKQVLDEGKVTAANQLTAGQQQTVPEIKEPKQIDFSKHPSPCQPFIPTAGNKANENPPRVLTAGKVKQKSQGTDDGFHSEPALCAKSIVHVANQIMSSKFSKSISSSEQQQQPPALPAAQPLEPSGVHEFPRKGSKSLPATPIASPMGSPDSSPKARRRPLANRYFTGTFLPDRERYQGGWILSSILGQSRELIVPKIEEEDESSLEPAQPPKILSRKKSISSQNLTYIGKEEKLEKTKSAVFGNVFQAKPSELREMNFWSPTSM